LVDSVLADHETAIVARKLSRVGVVNERSSATLGASVRNLENRRTNWIHLVQLYNQLGTSP